MAVEKDLKAGEAKIITAPKRGPGVQLSVEHFLKTISHRPHQSMLEVHNKQDGFAYRLAKNNPNKLRYWQQLGFEIVVDDNDATMSDSGQPDGRRVAGANELVLMKRPLEFDAMHKKALAQKASAARRGPIEHFKGKAQQMGVEVIDEVKEVRGPLEYAMNEDSKD